MTQQAHLWQLCSLLYGANLHMEPLGLLCQPYLGQYLGDIRVQPSLPVIVGNCIVSVDRASL